MNDTVNNNFEKKKFEFGRWESSYKDISNTNINESQVNDIKNIVFSCPVDHAGTTVYVKGWKPVQAKYNNPIILVHDIGQNIGFYTKFANYLAQKGFNFFCFDLRGHGCSGRILGHIASFDNFVNDLLQVAALIKHNCEGASPIVIGQGFGALITTLFENRYSKFCKGIILISPSFQFSMPMNKLKQLIVNIFSEIYPKAKLPYFFYSDLFEAKKNVSIKKEDVSKAHITNDVYKINLKFSAKLINEILESMINFKEHFLNIISPSLILYPKVQGIFEYQKIIEIVNIHYNKDNLTIKELDTTYHNMFTNQTIDNNVMFIDIIEQWIHSLK